MKVCLLAGVRSIPYPLQDMFQCPFPILIFSVSNYHLYRFASKVWDALTGDELHSFEHKHIVRACAFSEVMLVTCPQNMIVSFSLKECCFTLEMMCRIFL